MTKVEWKGDLLEIPMVRKGSREFVESLNHPCLNEFISKLPDGDFTFDSRSHVLKKGMYPCIPNWHLDGIKRIRTENQDEEILDFHAPENKLLEHYICFIGNAPTEILIGDVPLKWNNWKDVHVGIITSSEMWDGIYKTEFVNEREITKLEWNTFHRGTMAQEAGKRVFMRASFGIVNPRYENDIRKQTQVYVEKGYGW